MCSPRSHVTTTWYPAQERHIVWNLSQHFLLGGTLLVTPLLGADGEVYAVAQGQLAVGGFQAGGNAETVTKGVPTSGRIANGAIVEREVNFTIGNLQDVKLTLRNPDFTPARRIAQAINAFLGTNAARPSDPTTVRIRVPHSYDVVSYTHLTLPTTPYV